MDTARCPRGRSLTVVALLATLASPWALAQSPGTAPATAIGRPWPHETSDLPPDPALNFARLDNGLRVAWTHRPKPRGHCSLRLVVHVGSLDEADEELGMAHFVEHMAFNGTERFPGNTLIAWFQRHGMQAGRDANAFTSPTHTEFVIDLTRPGSVSEGLEVLCEFAMRMRFDPAEVAAEQGVIDAEERERLSPGQRAYAELSRRLLAGTRFAVRSVIGVRALRERFTAPSLRAFHTRWYRPDNMTLVIAGDLAEVDPLGAVRRAFGSLQQPVEAMPARAHPGTANLADTRFAIEAPTLASVEWRVAHLATAAPPPATRAGIAHQVRRNATAAVLRWEVAARLRTAFPNIDVDAGYGLLPPHGGVDGLMVRLVSDPADDVAPLRALAVAIRDLRGRGITAALLHNVREAALAEFDDKHRQQQNADAAGYANYVATCLADDRVPLGADSLRNLQREEWLALDTATCTATLRSAWPADAAPSITAVGPRPIANIAELWSGGEASDEANGPSAATGNRTSEASHITGATGDEWPYPAVLDGAPTPTRRIHHDSIGVDEVTFPNGVRLLLKPTSLAANEVQVGVAVGIGPGATTWEGRILSTAFARALDGLGLARVGPGRLRSLMASRQASFAADIGPSLQLRGTTTRQGLPFQLELLRAFCSDPGSDAEGISIVQRRLAIREARMRTVVGMHDRFLEELLNSPESASRPIPKPTAADLRAHFDNHLANAPTTVIVVGDFEVADAITIAAATFGRLPQRSDGSLPRRGVVRSGIDVERTAPASDDREIAAFVVPFAVEDDPEADPALLLLASVLEGRLLTRIREQLGASYSVVVNPRTEITDTTTHFLVGTAVTAAARAREVLDAMLAEAERMRRDGVGSEELARVREPIADGIRTKRNSNERWSFELLRAHSRPRGLAEAADLLPRLHAVTPADISRAAERLLRREAINTLVVRPADK